MSFFILESRGIARLSSFLSKIEKIFYFLKIRLDKLLYALYLVYTRRNGMFNLGGFYRMTVNDLSSGEGTVHINYPL